MGSRGPVPKPSQLKILQARIDPIERTLPKCSPDSPAAMDAPEFLAGIAATSGKS